MSHCLPPLKKKRRQASERLLLMSTLSGQPTAPLIPVDCLKSGNHLQSGTASCPSLLFNPVAFFSTTCFGSAFCLGKGALCNTGQHQVVVPGLQVSAALCDSLHNTVIYLSTCSLPPDAPFAATASPSLPNRSLLRGCAATKNCNHNNPVHYRATLFFVITPVKHCCRAFLSAFAAFSLIIPVSHKAPTTLPPDLKTGKCPALGFGEGYECPLWNAFPGLPSIPPPKSFKKRKYIGSGYSITCRTTQADNFSAIAR